MLKKLTFPVSAEDIASLNAGDMVLISGKIYCGRDAVLPRLVRLIDGGQPLPDGVDLEGGLIFHTAVSAAGVGPTSSSKLEIENSIPSLSKAGVRMHLGKGRLRPDTVEALDRYGSVFAVIPPVTALLGSKTLSVRVAAFPEEGMEALHELEVIDYPAVIAAAKGKTIYE